MPLSPRTSLGRYEVLSQLGAGGMGEVYLAHDTRLNRRVALKVLPPDFINNRDRLHRFKQEARAASALNHPNIITIHEFGAEDNTHFIVTEFIEGETLRQKLQTRRLEVGEALNISTQIAAALDAAHRSGIVHRDIKSENIMLREDDYVKVLDFGLAKLMEPLSGHSLSPDATTISGIKTDSGAVVGTVSYMSPEQLRGLKVDGRTDIWSLGIVLYEMVTGYTPFEGSNTSDVIASILDREPTPLNAYARGVPAELEWIVKRALRKDREERYQTMKEFLADLRSLKKELDYKSRLESDSQQDAFIGAAIRDDGRVSEQTISRGAARTGTATAAAHTTSSAEYIVSEIKGHKRGALLIATVIAAFIALGLYKLFWSDGAGTSLPLHAMRVTRITNNGKAVDAVISPDGKYIAYSVSEAGQQSLWIRHLATNRNVQIVQPAEVDYQGTTFSPDSSSVYFVRYEKNNDIGMLYQVSVLGGASRKLLVNIDSAVTFSPDGKQIAFVRRISKQAEDALMIANTDGTGERKFFTRKRPDYFSLMGPAWSPDGKAIACGAGSFAGNSDMTVVEVQVTSGAERPLTSRKWSGVRQVAWLADSSALVINAADQGSESYQVWQIAYPSGEARRITNDTNNYPLSVSLTRDSNALVTLQNERMTNIWVTPSNGSAKDARQIAFGKSNDPATSFTLNGVLSWTPDDKIVYVSAVSGNADLWIMNADGTNQKQLTDDPYLDHSPSVSPDNRFIVFASNRAGTQNIWRMEMDGRNPVRLTSSGNERDPYCSPDGRWVVYTSWGFGKVTLWKIPIDGGDPVQLTDEISRWPAVSPDGKLIACAYRVEQPDSSLKTRLAIISFDGGQPLKIFNAPHSVALVSNYGSRPIRWTNDGRSLTYIDTRDGVSNIWSQPLDGSPPKQLTDFKTDQIFWFGWSHDGRQLATARGLETNDVLLINNFR